MQNSDAYSARTKSNTIRLGYWTFAWLISLILASFGKQFIWGLNASLTLGAIILTLVTGAGMIWANKIHLQGLDELQQKIQLEAMGLALGVGLVAGLSYSLLDINNLIRFDAEISYLVILVGLVYMAGVFIGQVRYK